MKTQALSNCLTFKLVMRILAIFVLIFLVSATILYFYDTLAAAFSRLTWHDKKLASPYVGKLIASAMATVIGLGVLAESAATIWDKLIYWGQCIDNKIIYYYKGKIYFIDAVTKLISETRTLINQTNFRLQTITIPTNKSEKKNAEQAQNEFKKIHDNYCRIKDNCKKINRLLENNKAFDQLNKRRQEYAKNMLNTLVTENLQISDRIEALNKRFKFIDKIN